MAIPFSSTGGTELRGEFLSLVVPAYNEEARLPALLERVREYLPRRFSRFEVLVVDDGSTDGTAALVRSFPDIRLLRLERNSGKGAAVRAGVLASQGDLILFSDADLSTPLEEFERMLPFLEEEAAVVIGSRDLPGSRIERHQNALRETMGKTFNLLVRLLSGLSFADTQCGFKCFRGDEGRDIFRRCRIDGFAFDVEALLVARHLGIRVHEMPVHWINSPQSRVRIVRHSAQMLRDLVRVRWWELRGKYHRRETSD